MPIQATDVFKITNIPRTQRCEWSVTWPEYGRVNNLHNQAKLVGAAFESGAENFGISLANGNVHWLSSIVYYQSNMILEELLEHMNLMSPLTGFAFPERRYAESFVEAAEQLIIWGLLKKVYSDD